MVLAVAMQSFLLNIVCMLAMCVIRKSVYLINLETN